MSNVGAKFDDWFNDLFRDERDVEATKTMGTQQGRASRLSVGKSSTLKLKSTSGSHIRRQQALPEIIRKSMIDPHKCLDAPAPTATQLEEVAYEEALQKKKKNAKPHKLMVHICKEALEYSNKYRYQLTRHFEAKPFSKYKVYFRMEPGIGMYPYLIAMAQSMIAVRNKITAEPVNKLLIPPCVVMNKSDHFVMNQTSGQEILGGYSCQMINTCSDGCDVTTYSSEELQISGKVQSLVDTFYENTSFLRERNGEGSPIAVVKYSTFHGDKMRTGCAFVFSKDQLISELTKRENCLLGFQPFIKSKGSKPWCVRVLWQNNGCRKLWVLTSVDECRCAPVNQNTVYNEPGTNQDPEASENKDAEKSYVSISNLATQTQRDGKSCNIIQAGFPSWQVPRALCELVADSLKRYTSFSASELMMDFIQDQTGEWWLLQVKDFSSDIVFEPVFLQQQQITIDVAPKKRAKVVTKTDDKPRRVTKLCRGDYCKDADGEDKPTKQLAMKEITMDRIRVRAGFEVDKIQVDWEEHMNPREVLEQNHVVPLCDTCFEHYTSMALQRLALEETAAMNSSKHMQSEISRAACLRLYDRFVQAGIQKELEKCQFLADEGGTLDMSTPLKRKKKKKKKGVKAHTIEDLPDYELDAYEDMRLHDDLTFNVISNEFGMLDAAELIGMDPPKYDDGYSDDESQEDYGDALLEDAANNLVLDEKNSVICPFGCNQRILYDGTESLAGSMTVWQSHMKECAAFLRKQFS